MRLLPSRYYMSQRSPPRKAPPPSPKEVTEKKDKLIPFADDPYRTAPLKPTEEDVSKLSRRSFLTTTLIDYLLQRLLPPDLPDDTLIASSNSLNYFKVHNPKKRDGVLRRKYQNYSLRPYHFYSLTCARGHFFVVSIDFDMQSRDGILAVRVYDSLRKSQRGHDNVYGDPALVEYLRLFQQFLVQFCCFATRHQDVLVEDRDFILKKVTFLPCPQQRNSYDCGLFGLVTLLHLVDQHASVEDLFTPDDISSFRKGLHTILVDGEDVNREFLYNTFRHLRRHEYPVDAEEQAHAMIPDENSSVDSLLSDVDSNEDTSILDDNNESQDNNPQVPGEDSFDEFFDRFFKDKTYKSLQELDKDVDAYEDMSGVRLVIVKSTDTSRNYVCRTHISCPFNARFGTTRNSGKITLKQSKCNIKHSSNKAPDHARGRSHKKRLKGRLDEALANIVKNKKKEPTPHDLIVSTATANGKTTTYNQAYRYLQKVKETRWDHGDKSYELLIPYLDKFKELNEGSTVEYETDADFTIKRVFVCPGIMRKALMYVRPIISLDAAHMRGSKGILYMACVKTACEDIYTVAFALQRDNENIEGWTWFLRHLHSAIECLEMQHPLGRVAYKYFSFVSDRQKGLHDAISRVFPHNHSYFCAVHIARNVEKHGGKKVASYVHTLAETFSKRFSHHLWEKIQSISSRGRTYLEAIEPNRWLSTTWLDDPTLPPRYGILNTNLSESANNMMEEARQGTWMHGIDCLLVKMTERINAIRKDVSGKEGVVRHIAETIRSRWEECSSCTIMEGAGGGDKFIITRRGDTPEAAGKRYTIDVGMNLCECGEWQEHQYPCLDAMTYLKLHKRLTLNYIMKEYVDTVYTYDNIQEMMKMNIDMVCMETLVPDGYTLPPVVSRRPTGRPKKKRIRKRPRWACDPEKSPVACSKCKRRGHNIRTCGRREEMERDGSGYELDLS